MRRTLPSLFILLFIVLTAGPALAGNFVVHVQGRGWNNWNGETASLSGWTNVTLPFNGNSKLNGNETNVIVRDAIANHCTNGNTCIVHCYSAGCLRVLKAVSDLRASGNTLPGLLWVEASASAAGGTKLASIATKGFTGFLAKLLGQQEKIDYDLTPSAARNTWGYVQDDMGVTMYHLAGNQNICKKILFWKICGNKYVDAGVGDGVVGLDSASGASAAGHTYDGCAAAKYPYRTYEYADGASCSGEARDHFGMPGRSAKLLGAIFASPYLDLNRSWGDVATNPDCDDGAGACDNAFESAGQDFSKTPAGAPVSGDVSAYASNTTYNTSATTSCSGKCGGYAGACWCDAACTSFGDCCGDYYAANCPAVNQ
jgi:hypothetical protein